MTHDELMALGASMASVTKEYVAKAYHDILDRVQAMELRVKDLKDGRDGIDGKDGAPGERGEPGSPGVDGAPGRDGVDGTRGSDGAQGERGSDGKDGDIGPAGPVGEPGPVGPQGPRGEPGVAGAPGATGEKGLQGPEGAAGRDGRDGVPGAQGQKGVDGINGTNGRDGIDGMGFDDIQVEHDGERGFTLKFIRGEHVKTFGVFSLPVPIYRGVFKPGSGYVKGDTVTWGGSAWIATQDTSAKPGEAGVESRSWTLAVTRGRDGKSAEKAK